MAKLLAGSALFLAVVAAIGRAPAQPAEQAGFLFGRVVDAEQKPVAGAAVRVLRSRLESLSNHFDQNVWDHTFVCAEARADELGKFRVKLPEDGIYGVTAELGLELGMGIRNFVRVGDSLTLQLRPTREVRGRVVEAVTGGVAKPLADVTVRVLVRPDYGQSMFHGDLLRPMVVLRAVRSDGEGGFRAVVPTGETLHLGALIGTQYVYAEVGEEPSVDVVYQRATTVHGRVVDADSGAPVVGAALFDGYQTSEVPKAATDAEGAFSLELHSGLVHVVPRGHERAFMQLSELGSYSADKPLQIAVRRGIALKARLLRENGEPLAGARYYVTGPVETGDSIYGGISWDDRTGDDGRVSLGCLQPGQWVAGVVEVDGSYVPFLQLRADADRDLGDLRLSTASGALGTVLDSGGAPISAAVVFALPVATEGDGGSRCLQRFGVTGPTGRFSIRGLRPGHYDVAAAAKGAGPAFATWDTTKPAGDSALRLQRGETLRGRVVDHWGRPVADASVGVHQLAGLTPLQRRFDLHSYHAQTDERGHFAVTGLPAEAMVEVHVAGRVDGVHVYKSLGEAQVGDAELDLRLTQ